MFGRLKNGLYNLSKKKLILSITLNCFFMILILLFFKPSQRVDDYMMESVLYGRITGEYSAILQWSNVVLGYILVFLLKSVPFIPWYAVLQFICIYISMTVITFVLIDKKDKWGMLWILLPLMLYLQWDFYIYYTFTKTAGVLSVAGLLLMLRQIEERSIIQYLISFFLICSGILYRASMIQLILLIFFGAYIIYCIQRKGNRKKIFRGTIFFVVSVLMIMGTRYIFSSINSSIKSKDENWSQYSENHGAWSLLFDYPWPNYEENAEEYLKLGVSENDYIMWQNYANRTDYENLNYERMMQLKLFTKSHEKTFMKKIFLGIKQIFTYWSRDTMFYFFLSCCIIFIISERKKWIDLWIIVALLFVAYIYMVQRGRVMIHTDACMFLAGGVLILYHTNLSFDELEKRKFIRGLGLLVLLFVLFVNRFYDSLSVSPYYYATYDDVEKNNKELEILSKDKENLYLFGGLDFGSNFIQSLSGFSKVNKGYLHNIYNMAETALPISALTNFGVVNPLEEMIDNEHIYFVCSEKYQSQIDVVLTYLREHYDENTEVRLVKQTKILYIYSFYTESSAL